ncbi:hypothetical protein BRC84_03950 [Halobacteriales archaeon QS_1_68_44]|nr:MAG: hypothetical protein BRC84_03950 [Halobacteriales archaeon QS_1_68_44]
MDLSRKHIGLGILASVFLSPFVGGAVAGYLEETDVRRGVKIGGIVGGIVALVVGSLSLLYFYIGPYETLQAWSAQAEGSQSSSDVSWSDIWLYFAPYIIATGVAIVGSVLGGLAGGGVGTYVSGSQARAPMGSTEGTTRKNLIAGVATSTFLSTLVGGAVTGYLNGPDSRKMLRSGALVGVLVGLLLGAIVLLLGVAIALGSSGFDGMGELRRFIALAGLVFVGNVLMAVIGASIGNAIAYRNPPRHGRASTQ